MKRKTLTLVLCLLTVMSLVGVGFASWVISADASVPVEGNIIVDTVADKRLELTVAFENDQKDIKFCGAGETVLDPATNWLYLDDSSKVENLIVTVHCTLKYKGLDEQGNKIKFTVTDEDSKKYVGIELSANFIEPTNTALTTAKDASCIENKGAKIEKVKLDSTQTTLTFDVVITYAWGSRFDNKNPFDFYNYNKSVNDKLTSSIEFNGTTLNENNTWGDHAAFFLGLLDKIDNDSAATNYSLTITAANSTDSKKLEVETA